MLKGHAWYDKNDNYGIITNKAISEGKGAPIDRMSENRYFDKYLSHKFFNTNNRFSGSCILGQPVKM